MSGDPFESLAAPMHDGAPRAAFLRRLRAQLVEALDLIVDIPPRSTSMTATSPTAPAELDRRPDIGSVVTPYLCVHDGAAALTFYGAAFGAVESSRVVMDDGRLGHAEFTIGSARFYLSDEFPEIDVRSPRTLEGTAVTLHLQLGDVDDRFARAVAAGATALAPPADQPHGSRHGTLLDPFGHRWMLSTPVTAAPLPSPGAPSFRGVWTAVNSADALAAIRFAVDVLGFEERLVVIDPEDPAVVVHSELRWPEGGVIQIGSAHRTGNQFSYLPVGQQSLYVITAAPRAVYDRCVAAGVEVVLEPATPDYDPGGLMFTVTDGERNLWTFGTYAG